MIPVTKSFLPPLREYEVILKRAWDKQWITNRGELVIELEEKLKAYLGVKNILITNNGTIPLQIALKLFGKGGEIITTPFSYVATTAAIVWENCKPVFVDIHPEYLTIDEDKIESAITGRTTTILATHVFGNPCNVDAIEGIAKKHNLKVIYDAAHCFGVTYKNNSLFNFGDISTCSFHATKLFHTAEGGALFCQDSDVLHKLFYSHNFGHNGPLAFHGLGINGKISELQSAMGLAVFPYMETILVSRKRNAELYDKTLNFSKIRRIKIRDNTQWNHSYYPVVFNSEAQMLKVQEALNVKNIFPRRYFYPSLNTLPYLEKSNCPVSETCSSAILCLPTYYELPEDIIIDIAETINKAIG